MKNKPLMLVPFLTAFAAGAQAQTPAAAPEPAPSPFTANVSVTSNYKFRGQDQGNNKPALQGGFDWSMNGFYLGNWNSSIGFTNSGLEMDFYGGYKGAITEGLGYDVGLLQYYYPQKNKEVNFNTTELYGALTYQFLTLKYSHTVSKDYFGFGEAGEQAGLGYRPKGRGTGYLEANASFPLVDRLTLNAHVGYTRYSSDLRNARATFDAGEGGTTTVDTAVPNFYDYRIGLAYDLGSGFSVSAAIAGANKRGFYGDINKARGILTISKAM